MRDQFLIGRFLKAYSSSYRYHDRRPPPTPSFERTALEDRFDARRRAFRARQRGYAVHLQLGLLAAFVLVISAFQINLQPGETEPFKPVQQELMTMAEIVQTRQQVAPPPPPRPPAPVEVPDDEIIEEDDLDLDASLDITEPLAALPPPPPLPEPEVEEEEPDLADEIFVVVQQMPEIIGGMAALLDDLEYPPYALKAGLEGVVVIHVIIDEEGRPESAQVYKSVHELLDTVAVAAVMKQRFKPGLQRNRPVRVRLTVPIHFRLVDK